MNRLTKAFLVISSIVIIAVVILFTQYDRIKAFSDTQKAQSVAEKECAAEETHNTTPEVNETATVVQFNDTLEQEESVASEPITEEENETHIEVAPDDLLNINSFSASEQSALEHTISELIELTEER